MEIVEKSVSSLSEKLQKEIIVKAFYDLKSNHEIAEYLNEIHKCDFDENDIQLYIQRKVPNDSATSLVLFDELKKNSLIDEQTNMALNRVSQYRADTFLRLHEEVEKATKHMNGFIQKWTKEDDSEDEKDENGRRKLTLYDPLIYNTYLESLKTLSKVSSDLFKMADPVKIVSTGMKGITREYTLEVANLIKEFIQSIMGNITAGQDPESACVNSVRKMGSEMNEITERFLEKVELLAKNKTLANNF
jgi:hypothetical protein